MQGTGWEEGRGDFLMLQHSLSIGHKYLWVEIVLDRALAVCFVKQW